MSKNKRDPDCEDCYGFGWLISSYYTGLKNGSPHHINEIQRCDVCMVYEWDRFVRDPRAKKALTAADLGSEAYHKFMCSISGTYALTLDLPKVLKEQDRLPF